MNDIKEYINPGDVVFDVGAGEGEVSHYLAKEIKDTWVFALDFSYNVVQSLIKKREDNKG